MRRIQVLQVEVTQVAVKARGRKKHISWHTPPWMLSCSSISSNMFETTLIVAVHKVLMSRWSRNPTLPRKLAIPISHGKKTFEARRNTRLRWGTRSLVKQFEPQLSITMIQRTCTYKYGLVQW